MGGVPVVSCRRKYVVQSELTWENIFHYMDGFVLILQIGKPVKDICQILSFSLKSIAYDLRICLRPKRTPWFAFKAAFAYNIRLRTILTLVAFRDPVISVFRGSRLDKVAAFECPV